MNEESIFNVVRIEYVLINRDKLISLSEEKQKILFAPQEGEFRILESFKEEDTVDIIFFKDGKFETVFSNINKEEAFSCFSGGDDT